MTEMTSSSTTYCSVYEIDKGSFTLQGICVSTDISHVKRSIDADGQEIDSNHEENKYDESNIALDAEDELALDLSHFFTSLQKYYELAYISGRIDKMFLGGYFKSVIQNHAKERFVEVDYYNNNVIYKVEDTDLAEFNRIVERWEHIKAGIDSFAPAVLLSVVASFDSLFSELFKNLLLLRPERYNSSDRQLTVSSLLRLSSFEEVINKVVFDEVESITNRPHCDQILSFEKSFSISVKDSFKEWPNFLEIFERRNLAAHGDLTVDQKYLDNCKAAGLSIKTINVGDPLTVDRAYIHKTIDILIDLGTRLVFAAWHKQISDERAKAFSAMVETTYEMIKAGRYSVATSVAEFISSSYSKNGPDSDLKALIVNRAIAMKKLGDTSGAYKVLDAEDWSASATIYKICVFSIQEKVEDASKLLAVIKATEEISVNNFRDWPAFDWVRTDQTFAAEFENVFGEPLSRPVQIKSSAGDRGE